MKRAQSILLLGTVTVLLAGCSSETTSSEAAMPYPLDVCIVTDETIGADPNMKPYTFVYEGQEVKLCCKSCQKDFDRDPQKYLAKLVTTPVE